MSGYNTSAGTSTMDDIANIIDDRNPDSTIDGIIRRIDNYKVQPGDASLGSNTKSDIANIIHNYDRNHGHDSRYDPGVSYFTSVITPVFDLTPQYSGCTGSVEFRMRRKNKTVTLQWEPFSGSIAASGIANLTVAQSICNTPPYSISVPIYIKYKDNNRVTNITIDPYGKNGNIKFFLQTDGMGTNVMVNDAFYIYGGAVTWIVD